ncbi:MAG TPA: hypothetical protein VF678_10675, partial [bacterium]
MIDIWIGADAREAAAYDVCAYSLESRASASLRIRPIGQPPELYRRTWHTDAAGRRIDDADGRPFSTDFAFSRFLVPALMQYQGWALYCDCDFLFQEDVAALWALRDPRFAVQCVQHRHAPAPGPKMDGRSQEPYPRKNWSSLVLWNCTHPANRTLTVDAVNTQPGRWLHGFAWLPDDAIGTLPERWNWLSGWSSRDVEPAAIHYTGGGPWFENCLTVPLAERWIAEAGRMKRAAAVRLANAL